LLSFLATVMAAYWFLGGEITVPAAAENIEAVTLSTGSGTYSIPVPRQLVRIHLDSRKYECPIYDALEPACVVREFLDCVLTALFRHCGPYAPAEMIALRGGIASPWRRIAIEFEATGIESFYEDIAIIAVRERHCWTDGVDFLWYPNWTKASYLVRWIKAQHWQLALRNPSPTQLYEPPSGAQRARRAQEINRTDANCGPQ
jgi:hypothetical protein